MDEDDDVVVDELKSEEEEDGARTNNLDEILEILAYELLLKFEDLVIVEVIFLQ